MQKDAANTYVMYDTKLKSFQTLSQMTCNVNQSTYDAASTSIDDDGFEQSVEATYSREATKLLVDITQRWTREVQTLLNKGLLKPHPVREVTDGNGWGNRIFSGLAELQYGAVRGLKLAVRVNYY